MFYCHEVGEVYGAELPYCMVPDLPKDLTVHFIPPMYLVISAEHASWLVFSAPEYEIFQLLKNGKSIGEAIGIARQKDPENGEGLVSLVIGQVIAKGFLDAVSVAELNNLRAATIYLTDGCNLRCQTCYRKVTEAGPCELSTDRWTNFVSKFAENGGKILTVSGGEPLTRPDCPEILAAAKQAGLSVVLLTNGTLITKENADAITNACDEIQVSIDGPDSETNDAIRGEGSYAKAIAGLKLIGLSGCRISIAMTPTPATLPAFKEHLGAFVNWVHKNLGPEVTFRITQRLIEGRNENCTKCNQDVFRQEVSEMCDSQLEKGWFDMLDAAAIVPNRRVISCGYAQSFLVAANGDVFACGFCPYSVGNLKARSLDCILDRLRGRLELTRVEMLEPCRECDLRYFCGGHCRLENRQIDNSMQLAVCSEAFRRGWYERLVRINPCFFKPSLKADQKGDENAEGILDGSRQ